MIQCIINAILFLIRPGLKRNSGYGADTGGEIAGGQVRPYNRARYTI